MQQSGNFIPEELIVNLRLYKQNQLEVSNFSCEWYGVNYAAQILLASGSSIIKTWISLF